MKSEEFKKAVNTACEIATAEWAVDKNLSKILAKYLGCSMVMFRKNDDGGVEFRAVWGWSLV